MPIFSLLLAADVKRALALNCDEIKMQSFTYGPTNKVVKSINFSLADETLPFQIVDFIAELDGVWMLAHG